jgi:hypothetical protein
MLGACGSESEKLHVAVTNKQQLRAGVHSCAVMALQTPICINAVSGKCLTVILAWQWVAVQQLYPNMWLLLLLLLLLAAGHCVSAAGCWCQSQRHQQCRQQPTAGGSNERQQRHSGDLPAGV